ncbi:hypothetical protein BX661DRAFT_196827 [Kickxella alabastrina]|uniref:uncharacterized protein n=1 Tax=Kickxella alabastrina TaxID=61397 RepID=UPI00221E4892|nr:uncharacterized protein BX661DRAFT_196827 [Kickxella alabastrina]KAI7832944.1 hypothetical protein BX661DRAFT_196827 [Kickxella alabastrina]KAJ1945727.1 hypothetical protein GGF37_001551 [Kickxella alabastrina]
MHISKLVLLLACAVSTVYGLTEKEDRTVTDVLAILKRGTSIYPLEDLMYQLSIAMGFHRSAGKLSRLVPNGTSAYETVYDMLLYVDINVKHSPEQQQKLRQLIGIIGDKVLKLNSKDASFRTVVLQEEDDSEEAKSARNTITET